MQPIITVLGANNTPQGPFTLAEVERRIQTGEFSLAQMAHAPGLPSWAPLSEVIEHARRSGAESPGFTQAGTSGGVYRVAYADFGMRFLAVFIDNVILTIIIDYIFGSIVQMILYSVYSIHMPTANDVGITPGMSQDEVMNKLQEFYANLFESMKPILVPMSIWITFANASKCLYFAAMDGMGGTAGKRAMGLIVVTPDGRPISMARSFGRAAGRALNYFCCCCFIGYLFPLFNEQKKALHDYVAGTIVVKK